jgi:hypothetical protein
MPNIFFDGTDQYVRFKAVSTSGLITGTADGDALPSAILIYSEYKNTDSVISSPSVLWNATVGLWEATIPASYITQAGISTLLVSATNMIPDPIGITVISPTANVIPVLISPDIHPIGTTRLHSFNIYGADGSIMNTCTNPIISCSVNGATQTTPAWTISAYNNTMSRFSVSVVDPGWTHGDLIECSVMCDEGIGFFDLRVDDLDVRTKILAVLLGNTTGDCSSAGTIKYSFRDTELNYDIGTDGTRTMQT